MEFGRKLMVAAAMVFALLVLLAPSRAWAVEILDEEFRIDVDPGNEAVCVTMPASLSEPGPCAGIDVVADRKALQSVTGALTPLAAMYVREGTSLHFVLILHDAQARTDFDKDTARAYARGARDTLRARYNAASMSAASSLEPVEMRVRGVQITRFEMSPEVPAEHPRRSLSYTIQSVIATKQGRYSIMFMGAPEHASAVSALARRSLATVQAKPAYAAGQESTLFSVLARWAAGFVVLGVFAFFIARAVMPQRVASLFRLR